MQKNIDHIADFNTVVKENHLMIFRTILGFVHIREDAEDLTQEVFVTAYQNSRKFKGNSQISTWLYRIAVNTALNFVAQKQRRSVIQFGEDIWKSIFNKVSVEQSPQQILETDEENDIMQKAINSLPEKQRTAFILTRIDDLPQKEVAAIMGVSQRAVEQLLLRAKTNLNKKLGKPIRKDKQ